MTINPTFICGVNPACAPSGVDTGGTARFLGEGDESVGSTNDGIVAGVTTLSGQVPADFTITDTAADGFTLRPTRSGIYWCSMTFSAIAATEATRMGISLDTDTFGDTFDISTTGMRAFTFFEASGPTGNQLCCITPIDSATLNNPSTGFLRFHQDVTGSPEYTVYIDVQRIGDLG